MRMQKHGRLYTKHGLSPIFSTATDHYCNMSAHCCNSQTITDDTSFGVPSLRRASHRATPTHGGKMVTRTNLVVRKGMVMDEHTSCCCS